VTQGGETRDQGRQAAGPREPPAAESRGEDLERRAQKKEKKQRGNGKK